jgi:FtsP/CotA-like multicopper oxidase with cupredoxin domain
VKPGDVIKLALKNNMTDNFTNVHTHGLNVSPLGNGDNIFVHVDPGEIYRYEIALPADHLAGLFWYHPHAHGSSQFQVYNGMSGGLIVDGLLDPFPQLEDIADRTLLLKDTYVQDDGTIPPQDGDGDLDTGHSSARTVNGLVDPTMRIQPNELQLWRIGNIGANRCYRLVLEGHELYEIARDGNRHSRLVARQEILLPPSSRTEVLVRGGPEGLYKLRSLYVSTGPVGDQYAEETLATLVSLGPPVSTVALPTDSQFPPVPDLRAAPVARTRESKFQEDEPHRHRSEARRHGGVDARELDQRTPRLPHPPARLPGDRGERPAGSLRRLPGHRQHAAADRREHAEPRQGVDPVHQPDHRGQSSSTTVTSSNTRTAA